MTVLLWSDSAREIAFLVQTLAELCDEHGVPRPETTRLLTELRQAIALGEADLPRDCDTPGPPPPDYHKDDHG